MTCSRGSLPGRGTISGAVETQLWLGIPAGLVRGKGLPRSRDGLQLFQQLCLPAGSRRCGQGIGAGVEGVDRAPFAEWPVVGGAGRLGQLRSRDIRGTGRARTQRAADATVHGLYRAQKKQGRMTLLFKTLV
jgi:hypothetical protein